MGVAEVAEVTDLERLHRWFQHAHPELIGEGGVVRNAIRLLDWAYVGVVEDPGGLPAAAIAARGRRGNDPTARAADAIADLADTLTGLRELIDREEARVRAERERDEEREGRRAAAEWQEALGNVTAWIRGSLVMARNESAAVENKPDAVEEWTAEYVVRELDRRLRTNPYVLQYALQTLGGRPPKDLRAEAEQYAGQIVGSPEARDAAIEAYLAGAGVGR